MKRKDVISITGDLASGQSTVSKMLAEDLGFFLYRNESTHYRLFERNALYLRS